jgi:hypothetical protein
MTRTRTIGRNRHNTVDRILCISMPTRSRLTFSRSANSTSRQRGRGVARRLRHTRHARRGVRQQDGVVDASMPGPRAKSKRLANLTTRNTRSVSSRNVDFGLIGVRMRRPSKSLRPYQNNDNNNNSMEIVMPI